MRSLEDQIAQARYNVARWEDRLLAADDQRRRANDAGGGLLSFGGSGPQTAARKVRGGLEAAHRNILEAEERLTFWRDRLARLERLQAEQQRTRFTRADLLGATHVRTRYGWHEVVKVNAKSVTVATAYSWTDLVALDKILEIRTPPPEAA